VIELRQYRLQPGVRERFVALFDSELAQPQEAAGIRLLGRFQDLDRPDAFVWLRGFRDMASRAGALHEFYFGSVWAQHRQTANAMMRDSDDVLLLEPCERGPVGVADHAGPGALYVEICELAPAASEDYLERYQHAVAPVLAAAGAHPVGALQTLHAVNTFPRLPVRESVNVAVTLTCYSSTSRAATVSRRPEVVAASAALAAAAGVTPQRLRLVPTPASAPARLAEAMHDVFA
jgi:hypothetical protein